tara:strand:+ start:195 stop:464 length:270 start_codon:yes stop_codon:yes gene_type:complete
MKKGQLDEQEFLYQELDDIFGPPGSASITQENIFSLPRKLKEIEKGDILDALHHYDWNVAKTSRELGIGRTRLIARMKVLEIKSRSKGL